MTYEQLAPGIDTERLLRAIKRIETTDGGNNWPRVEVSYIPKGLAFTVQGRTLVGTGYNVNEVVIPRWKKWGLGSAASWGPWQILYHTAADQGYLMAPHELFDEGSCVPCGVMGLRRTAKGGALTVRDFADAWNSGSWRDANLVKPYTDAVEAAYAELV